MTIILALANKDNVIHLSDRRLSADGVSLDEESNKAGYLITDDSEMLFGFTGIAEYGGFKTRRWLLDTLANSQASSIRKALENFKDNASNYFKSNGVLRSLPPSQRRLTVMFTGFVGNYQIGNCLVTNYQNFETGVNSSECFDEFRIYPFICQIEGIENPTLVQRVGAWRAMYPEDELALRAMLFENKPREALVGKGVSLIRAMSDRKESNGTIGKQINSTCLIKGRFGPVSDYHTTDAKNKAFLTDMIDLRTGSSNLRISDMRIEFGGQLISIPKVGRNNPCPCGSGVKYKWCHGKKSPNKHG